MSKNKLNAFISSDNQVIDSWDEVSGKLIFFQHCT